MRGQAQYNHCRLLRTSLLSQLLFDIQSVAEARN